MSERRGRRWSIARAALGVLLVGQLLVASLFPLASGGSADAVLGDPPAVSTMVDAAGNPIAWLYTQRRWEVPEDRIAETMKAAIIAIEDKRFASHHGVDVAGTLTGLVGYLTDAPDTRGGSTIEQQYVKNYNLLVSAGTDEERRAAVETTPTRKLREIRMALALDKVVSKPELLTRYLNLVSFGNGAFGVQDAARTYFGIDASQLNWPQAALLAGIVQSTTGLDPYTNPQGALDRRNLVLENLIASLPDKADELKAAESQPLGILPQPVVLPQGCIAAGDRAFFCEYALQYLAQAGLSRDDVARNGYLIRTTLDPKVQSSVKQAVDSVASPTLRGVASVMSVILPGKDAHRVVAIADNHVYGLDLEAGETVQPQPFSMVGDGAGSVFKIFTAAAALDPGGMGIETQLEVPVQFQGSGLGDSSLPGCPPHTWCVKNAGAYGSSMSMTDALAQSPNTAFARLIQRVGVGPAVDMAVKLGLRSYAEPGSARAYDPNTEKSLADYIKDANLGSFTLGPFPIDTVELSNVAATLASGGTWCPASPIDKVFDRHGGEVSLDVPDCEQAVPAGLADTLATGLSRDATSGTAAASAGSVGWRLPMGGKTGTTESHRSSAFVGFTNRYAAANYIFDDSPQPTGLCSFPLRQCSNGDLYGGKEPARTWFLAMNPIANDFGPVALPPTDPRYVHGDSATQTSAPTYRPSPQYDAGANSGVNDATPGYGSPPTNDGRSPGNDVAVIQLPDMPPMTIPAQPRQPAPAPPPVAVLPPQPPAPEPAAPEPAPAPEPPPPAPEPAAAPAVAP